MDSNINSSSARMGGNGRKKGIGKGANNQSELTNEKYRAPRSPEFTQQETKLLIILIGERLKARTNRNEGNINPSADKWNYIGSQFNYRSAQNKRHVQVLKNRWKTLKADFSFFKDLASRSGHGWNEADGIPDVTPEAWEEYIKIDEKRYKPYRHKKFPWFRAMEELCGNDWVRGCFMNQENDMLRGYVDHILHRYQAGLPLIPNLGGSGLQCPSPSPHFMTYPYGMGNAPSHILHHVASQTPPPMTASPVAYPRNINNPPHINVSGDEHNTPCTPSSNPHPPSDFYHPWT